MTRIHENKTEKERAAVVRLRDVRHSLLRLHKALLDDERAAFERVRGRIESSGEFLQLVLHDECFAWLRPLSELVVQIDERLDADEPLTESEARELMKMVHALVKATGEENFARKYRDALQRNPDVVLAHAAALKLIG
jgi:hypothetical protein